MMQEELEEQINKFWEWFGVNTQLIEEVLQNQGHVKTEYVIQQLDQHLLGMGKFKWDVKNPNENNFHLIISPNNDRELLKTAKVIVNNAILPENWMAFSGQQANGLLQISVYDEEMDICSVDATNWRALLLPSAEGRFELVIEADTSWELEEDTQLIAIDLLLNQLLGEELKITALAGLEIVEELESEESEEAFPFKNLPVFLMM